MGPGRHRKGFKESAVIGINGQTRLLHHQCLHHHGHHVFSDVGGAKLSRLDLPTGTALLDGSDYPGREIQYYEGQGERQVGVGNGP